MFSVCILSVVLGSEESETFTTISLPRRMVSEDAVCIPRDSDTCLMKAWKDWGEIYTCANSAEEWCHSWNKDMHRCCPESCGTGSLTEAECNALGGEGVCDYPNESQCRSKLHEEGSWCHGRVALDDYPVGKPWIYHAGGGWKPLNGHWFWENSNGANQACKDMGYEVGGKLLATTFPATKDSLITYMNDRPAYKVGLCEEGESPADCSEGLKFDGSTWDFQDDSGIYIDCCGEGRKESGLSHWSWLDLMVKDCNFGMRDDPCGGMLCDACPGEMIPGPGCCECIHRPVPRGCSKLGAQRGAARGEKITATMFACSGHWSEDGVEAGANKLCAHDYELCDFEEMQTITKHQCNGLTLPGFFASAVSSDGHFQCKTDGSGTDDIWGCSGDGTCHARVDCPAFKAPMDCVMGNLDTAEWKGLSNVHGREFLKAWKPENTGGVMCCKKGAGRRRASNEELEASPLEGRLLKQFEE